MERGRVPPADAAKVIHNIGRRVAEERIRLQLTQAAFAERVGVSLKYLQRVEAGRENLTVSSLVRLANLLGVTPRDLFAPASLRNAGPGRPPKGARNATGGRRTAKKRAPAKPR